MPTYINEQMTSFNRPSDRIRLRVESRDESGVRNMAIDECLLETALTVGQSTVRIYGWDAATISLGYFQPPDEAYRNENFRDLPVVRRLTGGGAILHHLEVTYSCTLAASHPLALQPSLLYVVVHEAIRDVFARHGVQAQLRGSDQKSPTEPFLCFSRGDRNDLVIGETKIAGSAQRRRRGAVLQHGSLLLRRSQYASDLLGVLDLIPGGSLPDTLRTELGRTIADALGAFDLCESYTEHEMERVDELLGKYAHLDRSRYRSHPV